MSALFYLHHLALAGTIIVSYSEHSAVGICGTMRPERGLELELELKLELEPTWSWGQSLG